jgi:hypothetical protein
MTGPARYSAFGYGFAVTGSCRQAIDGLAEDFAFFAVADGAPAMTLVLDEGTPDYDAVPACDASVYTPRNVVYRAGHRRFLDFGGRGLGVLNAATRTFRMMAEDPDLVYEAAYLFLLSQIGAHGDVHGLHRVHAMAVAVEGRAIVAMLPMGGGKSTLLAALLAHPGVSVLSDDSPFIDRRGGVHAFPLRLGVLEAGGLGIPTEQLRRIDRMEFGPKYLVNYAHFADRVAAEAPPGLLVVGRRTMAREGRLERASSTTMLRAMVPHCIVGLGLFQGLEYLLSRSPAELVGKAGVVWSRTRNARALVRRSQCHVLHLGRDHARNASLLLEAAARLPGGR